MENDGGQLFEEDMGFIYEKEDLVTLRPGREHAWLDGLLERILKVLRCRLIVVRVLETVSSRQGANVSSKFLFCSKVSEKPSLYTPQSNHNSPTGNQGEDRRR